MDDTFYESEKIVFRIQNKFQIPSQTRRKSVPRQKKKERAVARSGITNVLCEPHRRIWKIEKSLKSSGHGVLPRWAWRRCCYASCTRLSDMHARRPATIGGANIKVESC